MKRAPAQAHEAANGVALHFWAAISAVLGLIVALRLRVLVMFEDVPAWCSETGGVHAPAFHDCALCGLAALAAILAALSIVNLGLRVAPILESRAIRR